MKNPPPRVRYSAPAPASRIPNTEISQEATSISRNVATNCRLLSDCRVSLTRIGFSRSLPRSMGERAGAAVDMDVKSDLGAYRQACQRAGQISDFGFRISDLGAGKRQIRNPNSQIRDLLHDPFRNGHERILQVFCFSRELDDLDPLVNEPLEEACPGRVVPLVLKRDCQSGNAHRADERLL